MTLPDELRYRAKRAAVIETDRGLLLYQSPEENERLLAIQGTAERAAVRGAEIALAWATEPVCRWCGGVSQNVYHRPSLGGPSDVELCSFDVHSMDEQEPVAEWITRAEWLRKKEGR